MSNLSPARFSAVTKTADLWKSITSIIRTTVDEANFEANDTGIQFRSMDPSHIALIDVNCPAAAFEKYECKTPVKFGLKLDNFERIMKRAVSAETVELSLRGILLDIQTTGIYPKDFKIKLLEKDDSTVNVPKYSFESKLVIYQTVLQEILSDIEAISPKVTIETTVENRAVFSTKGDTGEAKIVVDEESAGGTFKEISLIEPSQATYGTELISKVVKTIGNLCEHVTIEYSTNKPMKLTFVLSNSVKVEFFVAPRVVS